MKDEQRREGSPIFINSVSACFKPDLSSVPRIATSIHNNLNISENEWATQGNMQHRDIISTVDDWLMACVGWVAG